MEGFLPPLKLSGVKRARNNNTNNNNNNNTRTKRAARFNTKNCGSLEEGERCVLRKRLPGEVYGSHIYEIFYKNETKMPAKIRKLVTLDQIDGFRAIQNEVATYESLNGLPDFKVYCLPFLKYKGEETIRYIDFAYQRGETLQDYIHKHKVSKIGRRILLAQAIKCLLFLASADRIHGDIKLDNFWYDTEAAQVRIFDFELSLKNPPIINRVKPVSLLEEFERFVNLIEYPDEFGFSAKETEALLGGTRDQLLERIEESKTKEEGFERLIGIYRHVLKQLALSRGGAVRQTRRKNRATQ
jgi:serine/threonine protein kinase